MKSFKAYFLKEIMESIRQNRYIILFIGFIVWAILNPMTLKLLPYLLADQLPPEVIETMMSSQSDAFMNYLSDVFTIGNLFVIFSLMGILADEIGRQRLVLPYSKGVKPSGIVLAKYIHYVLTIWLLIAIGFSVNYIYTSFLFERDALNFVAVAQTMTFFALYFSFNLSLLMMFSSFFKKGIAPGILTLLFSYFSPLLSNIKFLKEYQPYYLIQRTSELTNVFDTSAVPTVIITLILIMISLYVTNKRMQNVEVV